MALEVAQSSFNLKVTVLKRAQKVAKYFGFFCMKICHVQLSNVAQSGPTATKKQANKQTSKQTLRRGRKERKTQSIQIWFQPLINLHERELET